MAIQLITPLKARQSLYSDFYKDMTFNPITNDLAVKYDEDAVKESIKNIILTDRGERLFQPTLGGDIRAMLFENNTPATLKIIQEQVKTIINSYETRANVIDVQTTSNIDDNVVAVKIIFAIRNREDPVTVTVFLERVR